MNVGEFAPVALFVYKRPRHTQKTVEALRANSLANKTDLYIFSDGPRTEQDGEFVQQVRNYIAEVKGFKSINIIERYENHGLSRSIIDGVSHLCRERGRVIVLEDDLVVSPFFLEFMNDGLDLYEKNENVISIHGYSYPTLHKLPELFFLRGADCWGWATWRRGWDLFEADGSKLLSRLRACGLRKEFDFNGTYPYTRMLQDQVRGKNDSWAIRWYASAFLEKRLTLYPGRSLVHNIGNDSSGTHCGSSGDFAGMLTSEPIKVWKLPTEESEAARRQFEMFFMNIRPAWHQRLKRRTSRLLRVLA